MKSGLEIIPVKWIDKVLEVALERKPVPLSDEEAAVTAVTADKTSPAVSNDSLKH